MHGPGTRDRSNGYGAWGRDWPAIQEDWSGIQEDWLVIQEDWLVIQEDWLAECTSCISTTLLPLGKGRFDQSIETNVNKPSHWLESKPVSTPSPVSPARHCVPPPASPDLWNPVTVEDPQMIS